MPADLQLRRNPGRRPRMTDAETEERMLTAGRRFVATEGLSLSLEHLRMEDLIRDAGVSRTSSYRRWPTKDLFAADLLLHIAESTRLTPDHAPYAAVVGAIDPGVLLALDTGQGRRDAIVEVFRVLTAADFAASLASESWRSYLVLRAAHGSLPEGELRTRITDALRVTERGFTTYRAGALAAAAGFMGYRLVDAASVDWTTLAQLLSAAFAGMAVNAFSDPEAVLAERELAPFGSSRTAGWSLVGLASGQLFFGATEPDPTISWDAARVRLAQAQLRDADATLGALWATGSVRASS